MDAKVEKVEQAQKKQPYETPQLTKHGSVEQLTGLISVSAFTDDAVNTTGG